MSAPPDRSDAGDRAAAGQGENPEHLVVGHIPKPHGTRGEVFVWPLTDRPDEIFVVGRELILGEEDGRVVPGSPSLEVERVRSFKRGLLVKFRGLDDRTVVEPLAKRYLLVPMGELSPLEEGELYYHQLLGLEVVTHTGEVVGRVREVYETQPMHLLEVEDDGRLRLIPFAQELVREVDLTARRMVIDPPSGLLEL